MKEEDPAPEPTSPEVEEEIKDEESEEATSTREKKPRVPSALTVENLKKHEEGTDAIDVVELMTKNGEKESEVGGAGTDEKENLEEDSDDVVGDKSLPFEEESCAVSDLKIKNQEPEGEVLEEEPIQDPAPLSGDIWSQPKKSAVEPIPSPAKREEVRGVRFTGEEYIAISIDVQTDETRIAEMLEFDWPQDNLDIQNLSVFHISPAHALSASDGGTTGLESDTKRHRKHITSDISTGEIVDEESVLQMTSDTTRKKAQTASGESETEDENVVNEVAESLDGSEAQSHTTSQTLPSVGPPFILQYKPESQMIQIDYEDVAMTIPENVDWDDMNPEQREYYKTIMEDMKKLRIEKKAALTPDDELISIEPHSAYGSQHERKLAKERERERSRMREMKKQSRQAQAAGGQVMSNQTNFYAFARQLKTVNYALSSEKCMEEGWTIRPKTPTTPEEAPSEVFIYDPSQDIMTGKRFQRVFVKKLYPNGSIFLTVFPDGTGNVWYPSGNLAFSIIASEKMGKLSFIVHEDVSPVEGQNIQAIFEPSGHCTCYYPSGIIRLLLTHLGGEYFGPQGERLKKWIWKDTQTHVHAPPFQPITFALSKRVGIRVIAQESIYITFTDGGRSVRFNAGTRLRMKPAAFLPKLQQVDIDRVLLDEKRARVQSIIERIQMNLKFPHSPRLQKLQLPNYLNSQLNKNEKIRQQMEKQQVPEKATKMKSAKKKISEIGRFIRHGTKVI